MSRFFAYRGNEPERLRLAMHSLRSVLFPDVPDVELLSDGAAEQPLSGQKTRWGLGYYVGGEAHVQRFAALPAQGFFALRSLRCETVLGHGSDAAADASPQKASPHRYGRLLLSLQAQPGTGSTMMALPLGSVVTDAPADDEIEIPEYLQRNLRDGGAAELLLHRFCARLDEADPDYLSMPQLPSEVALAVLAAVAPPSRSGASQQLALTNGDWLIVARRGPSPVYYRSLQGLYEGETHHESFSGFIAVSQSGLTDDAVRSAGLSELQSDQALVISSDLSLRAQPF